MIGIVVVTFNSEREIAGCLQSLAEQTYQDVSILAWDNASHDNTRGILKGFPRLKTVFSPVNIGFAEACNRAARSLLEEGCEGILFLNPDTVAEKTMLHILHESMTETGAGIVQPAILLFDKKRINTEGNSLHYLGFSFCSQFQKAYRISQPRPIAVASGACMLVDKAVFSESGFFCPEFFAYHEDTDFCWRARLTKQRIMVAPQAVLYHDYVFRVRGRKYLWLERNRLIMVLQNYSARTLILITPILLLLEIQMLVYSLFSGWIHWKLLSYFHLAWLFPKILARRKGIQGSRRVSDREIISLSEAKIEFPYLRNFFLKNLSNPILQVYYRFLKKYV